MEAIYGNHQALRETEFGVCHAHRNVRDDDLVAVGGLAGHLVPGDMPRARLEEASGPAVTVSVEGMAFLHPAHAGDLLTVHAVVEHAGLTSMDVGVRVTAERWDTPGPVTDVVTAHLVFVATGADGRPRPVAELRPASAEDERRHARALRRRALRVRQAEAG
ncbi:acyl-CoA thioesterase [Streptomyces sp. NPDC001902]